jgi:hypothetical protein
MSKILTSINPIQNIINVNEKPICIICLSSTPTPKKYLGSCNCRPEIHLDCMHKWLTENSNTCPICRQKYSEKYTEKNNTINRNMELSQNDNMRTCTATCTCCCYLFCFPLMIVFQ